MEEQRQAAYTALAACSRLWATAELPGSLLHAWLFTLACVLPCSSLAAEEHNLYGQFPFNILIFPGQILFVLHRCLCPHPLLFLSHCFAAWCTSHFIHRFLGLFSFCISDLFPQFNFVSWFLPGDWSGCSCAYYLNKSSNFSAYQINTKCQRRTKALLEILQFSIFFSYTVVRT